MGLGVGIPLNFAGPVGGAGVDMGHDVGVFGLGDGRGFLVHIDTSSEQFLLDAISGISNAEIVSWYRPYSSFISQIIPLVRPMEHYQSNKHNSFLFC